MESLQLSQVLADLSNLGAAEPEAAEAIVAANTPAVAPSATSIPQSKPQSLSQLQPQAQSGRPSSIKRAWSTEPGVAPKFDKLGRRILVNQPSSRPASAASSMPGTPRRGDSDVRTTDGPAAAAAADAKAPQVDEDVERATTLMALYDIRAKIRQQDNSSLIKAREKINAMAARQQAQQAAEALRRNRYAFPKSGL